MLHLQIRLTRIRFRFAKEKVDENSFWHRRKMHVGQGGTKIIWLIQKCTCKCHYYVDNTFWCSTQRSLVNLDSQVVWIIVLHSEWCEDTHRRRFAGMILFSTQAKKWFHLDSWLIVVGFLLWICMEFFTYFKALFACGDIVVLVCDYL